MQESIGVGLLVGDNIYACFAYELLGALHYKPTTWSDPGQLPLFWQVLTGASLLIAGTPSSLRSRKARSIPILRLCK